MKPIPMIVGITGDEAPLSCGDRVDELKQKIRLLRNALTLASDYINDTLEYPVSQEVVLQQIDIALGER